MAPRLGSSLVRCLVGLIGLHSCLLGIALLALPRLFVRLMGFSGDVPLFFPSQCGIFLLVLGLCYLWALVEPPFVKVILISKACAVVFLLVHAALLSAPPIIWAAFVGDGGMLAALGGALLLQRREEAAAPGRPLAAG